MSKKVIFTFLYVVSTTALASSNTNVYLKNIATQYIKQSIPSSVNKPKIIVKSIPDNVVLKKCQNAPDVSFQNHDRLFGERIVSISCDSPYWHIYLNVSIHAKVPVVVSSHAIMRDSVLFAKDFNVKRIDTSQLSYGYFSNIKDLVDTRSRVFIKPNEVIHPQMILKQADIRPKTRVKITCKSGTVYVSMLGIALQSGRIGDFIQVKNLSSGKIVDARVLNRSEVLINS